MKDQELIKKLVEERDEARRQAIKYWILLQCESENQFGTQAECKRLGKIFFNEFGIYPSFGDLLYETPPYDLELIKK